MVVMRRILALAAIAAAMLLLSACERKITYVTEVSEPQSCFDCHSDSPSDSLHLVAARQQWEHSKHASGETLNENGETCKNCHTSEGFVARAATGTPFTANSTGEIENPTAIHCFTCHAPHTSGDFRLRWTATTTLQNAVTFDLGEGNLCAACHQSRRDVRVYIKTPPARTTINNRFGPHHSPQGDVLIGTGGYEYAGYTYERTNHRGLPDGCIKCHMKTTLQYVVGGHTWNMEAMLGTEEVRNVAACSQQGCHNEIDDFNQITLGGTSLQDSVETRMGELRAILVAAGMYDDAADEPASGSLGADSAGALYNYMVAKEDRSIGVHNPKYVLGLLDSAIKYMTGDLTPPPAPPLAATSPRRR